MTEPKNPALEVKNLCIERAGFPIVTDLSLEVRSGAITVILGPNGAGKTTLLEALSGVISAKSGTVRLAGLEISKAPRQVRARAGLAHVEQGRTVFPGLTVEENLIVGEHHSNPNEAFAQFPELEKRRKIAAGMLSGGEQQMLVIARALMGRPNVLMVDEMSLGLAPLIVKRLMPEMRRLADAGMAVLLVEQFAHLALEVADHAMVLSGGRSRWQGAAKALIEQPEILRRAYLGAEITTKEMAA
jgi:branched-chain amino acid transport system ATP-binding protein